MVVISRGLICRLFRNYLSNLPVYSDINPTIKPWRLENKFRFDKRDLCNHSKYSVLIWILLAPLLSLPLHAEEIIGEFDDPYKNLTGQVIQYQDGEEYNALTGEMGYYLTDFNIPGNGLPIQLGRRFQRKNGYPHEFDTMSLEVPRIEYYHFGKLSYTQRCRGGECVDDYGKPSVGGDQCAGLKMYDVGSYAPQGEGEWAWQYGRYDLYSDIKLIIGNRSIRFFPVESVLNTTRFPAGADYISPDNWHIDCVGTNWVATSPQGITYTFNVYEHVFAGEKGSKATIYISRAEDTYARVLDYTYESSEERMVVGTSSFNNSQHFTKKRLISISADDGRSLSLTYSGSKITRMYDNGSPNQRLLNFTYRPSGEDRGLARVTQLDLTFWAYHYRRQLSNVDYDSYNEINAGISLTQIITPQGLQIDYQQLGHKEAFHTDPARLLYPSIDLDDATHDVRLDAFEQAAIKQRSLSGPGLPAGMIWNYNYYKKGASNQAITYITGPSSTEKLTFRRRDFIRSPLDARSDSGRLLESAIYPLGTSYNASSSVTALKQTTTSWLQRPSIVNQSSINNEWNTWNNNRRTAKYWSSYHAAMNTVPGTVTTTVDGVVFAKTYSAFDEFDNSGTLTETGNGGTRVIKSTYHNDSTNWIIGRLKDESIVGAGPGILRSYNAYGQLESEQRYGLSTSTYDYYESGDSFSGDSLGELEQISWDRDGLPLTRQFDDYYRDTARLEVDPDGQIVQQVVNDDGSIASNTDENGKTTSYAYDNMRRVASISTPLYGTASISWTNSGQTKTAIHGNYQSVEQFDELGRSVSSVKSDTSDPANDIKTATEYDSSGRTAKKYLPAKTSEGSTAAIDYTYDELHRLETLTHGGDVTSYCYQPATCTSADGKLSFGYAMTDPRGFTTVRNFLAYGQPSYRQLIEIHDMTGDTPGFDRLTTIDRNDYGDITRVARGSTERLYNYVSDKPRNIQQVIEPETGTTAYTYRSDGTLSQVQTGSSVTIFQHDNSGLITDIDYPGSTPDIRFEYYSNGQLYRALSGENTTDENIWTYLLNTENDLTQEMLSGLNGGNAFTLDYAYNSLGDVNKITYPSNRVVDFEIDALGRTTSITHYISDAAYYPNGSLQSITFANGQTMAMGQNAKQLPETMITALQGNPALVDLSYSYDANNNISSIIDPIQNDRSLSYDGANRLTGASGPWGTGSIVYDPNDNIRVKQMGTESLSYTYDESLNRLKDIADGGAQQYNFSYDVYGNVTSNGTNSFVYDDASNLRTSGSNSYLYDAHNRRALIDRPTGKQFYVYSKNGQLMFRYNEAEQQTTDYIYLAGQLIARHDEKPDPLDQAGTPTISPNGGAFNDGQLVELELETPTNGVSIYYTSDGSDPTSASSVYSGPFNLTSSGTFRATAIGDGYQDSVIATASFTFLATAPTLTGGGNFINSVDVTMSKAAAVGAIYYTTDGITPTISSTRYTNTLTVSSTTTINTITIANGMTDSGLTQATYTIQAAAPAITPGAGTYTVKATISMNTSTTGGTIRYTTDGSTPTSSSTPFTGSFVLTGAATVKAQTFASGKADSGVISHTYSIKAGKPSISSTGWGNRSRTVSLSGASPVPIYYTLNRSTPTTSSARYTGSFKLANPNCSKTSYTVKARAIGGALVSSDVASAYFYLTNTLRCGNR